MYEGTPHIDVRAVQASDAPALYQLDNDFETDRIYTLRVQNHLLSNGVPARSFTFELVETPVDPPLYKNLHEQEGALAQLQVLARREDSGFVALADQKVVGGIFLDVDEKRLVARIRHLVVGRQYRRLNVGALLLSCASDWAREHKCWALQVETCNTNFPDIQSYLRSGLEIWSINCHFYPPGEAAHDIAIFMGKRLSITP